MIAFECHNIFFPGWIAETNQCPAGGGTNRITDRAEAVEEDLWPVITRQRKILCAFLCGLAPLPAGAPIHAVAGRFA